MPRVIAKGPDGHALLTLDLDEHRAVLLGRNPDRGSVRAGPEPENRSLETMFVAGPSVSANHAIVWSEKGAVCARDLGSRNGTWLLLPRGQTVRVECPEVVLQLAQPPAGVSADDEPPAPTWKNGREYAPSMASSIERWLHSHGVAARATICPAGTDHDSAPTRVPLATGESVDIAPLGTTSARWSRLLEQLWRWTARQNSIFETEEETRREGMILASDAIRSAHREVADAAENGVQNLLLTGATGAGKEMLAEVFHRHTGRGGPLVAINCSLFTKEFLRTELFGAEAGAFTGATHRIVGAVERAQGGTLFLDEIGEIPAELQPMLLRFLDRREYERLGQYGRAQRADIRVVAATNRDLRDATRTGGFRADLWYRLAAWEVDVPPLRGRWEDITAYLDTVRVESGRTLLDSLAPEALELLRAHPWDGNFRELRSFAERVSRGTRGEPIDAAACRRALEKGALSRASVPTPPPPPADWPALAVRAIEAFVEDHGHAPATWNEQKEWNEKYLKPVVFFHLSGAAQDPPTDDDAMALLVARAAVRVQADRGTAHKQLARYLERFSAPT